MASLDDEHDLVLGPTTPLQVELARQLLEEAGIPALVDGPSLGAWWLAETGQVYQLTLHDWRLYVPTGSGPRALETLREAWGEGLRG